MHHIKEEEHELFPQLERARIDWETIAREMNEQRAEMAPPASPDDSQPDTDEAGSDEGDGGARGERGNKSSGSGRGRGGRDGRTEEHTSAGPSESGNSRRI